MKCRVRLVRILVALCAITLLRLPAAAETPPACADEPLKLGFYASFDPVSYSADSDPESDGFDEHLGYEADLLSALEAMDGAGLAFERAGIGLWDDIWLRAATPDYDIVAGGITILESRTRDAAGEERIVFTAGHVTFRQSLLVRAADVKSLDSHDKLGSDDRVAALPGTTGEQRLLQLTGYVDEAGALLAGTIIETPDGELVADGSGDFVITAGFATQELLDRRGLQPPVDSMPQVVYVSGAGGEAEALAALADGDIDAFARGEIGNLTVAKTHDGAFIVTALDDAIENGGFALGLEDAALADCLDEKIGWLTDERRIGISDWLEDAEVFMKRAEAWNAAPGSSASESP